MAGQKKLGDARQHTGDRQIDAIQDRVRRLEAVANACPFLFGVLRSVQFDPSSKVVSHGLGTKAAFFVVRENYDTTPTFGAELYEDPDQSNLDAKNQTRIASAVTCTLDLWFYPVASEAKPR